jgi:hypothetical protein
VSRANYSVIRYIPDPGRGESLNVGILLWDEDEFRLNLDDKAIERVIRENPRLERDSLLYVEPVLNERLATAVVPVAVRIRTMLESQKGFPIELSEPRFTTVEPDDDLDVALERLTARIVRPRRRTGGGGTHPAEVMERRLKRLLDRDAVSRNYFFAQSKSGVPRKADFFANSDANVALDVLRLALKRADDIRLRADAEAFKVYDILEAENPVHDYVVFCEFAREAALAETNENARKVIETQGARIVTDLDEATRVLAAAASPDVDGQG